MVIRRLFGLLLIVAFAGMIYYNWYTLRTEGTYYMKMATMGPVGIVGGLVLLFFPAMGGTPRTTREKVIVFGLFAIGIVAGLINWFLMDPGFFGFGPR
jgi:hypothetical protein